VSGRPRSFYARVLRLRHTDPGGLTRLLFVEGAMILGGLAALAEFASWWAVAVLPAIVALLVKLDDVANGARRARNRPGPGRQVVRATAAIPLNTVSRRPLK